MAALVAIALLGTWLLTSDKAMEGVGLTGGGLTILSGSGEPARGVAPTAPTEKVVVQPRASSNVVSVVAGLSGANTFQGLFTSTGVASTLNGKGPYTVFVPTDAGLAYAPKGSIRNMTSAQKKEFVEYHIVMGRMLLLDALDSGTIMALSGDTLNFQVQAETGLVQVNSAFALQAYKAGNGIVYTINQPLFPPQH